MEANISAYGGYIFTKLDTYGHWGSLKVLDEKNVWQGASISDFVSQLNAGLCRLICQFLTLYFSSLKVLRVVE